MVDWSQVVRTRLADLRLTASAESELAEELAQHLEDLHRELLSGGATNEDAYREALSELDDIYALRAGVDRSQRMAKLEPVPAGDPMSRTLLNDLLRDYFQVLGVGAAMGRTFGSEADAVGGPQAVAVMNYGTWRTRFGAAADIVGRQLRINNVVVTVVGVTPQGFIGVTGVVGPELWLPFAVSEQLLPNETRAAVNDRSKPLLHGVARLRPGVTLAQAHANIATLADALAREYPVANPYDLDGVSAEFDDWHFNVRQSNTEPCCG